VTLNPTQGGTVTLMAHLKALWRRLNLDKALKTVRVSLTQKASMKTPMIQRVTMTLKMILTAPWSKATVLRHDNVVVLVHVVGAGASAWVSILYRLCSNNWTFFSMGGGE
jgi:triacylglycerol esterase/lipase EstA (alpha/beta hydrolase family)